MFRSWMRAGAGAVRESFEKMRLLFRGDDVGCAGDAGGLHVAFNLGPKRTDFEVAINGPAALVRNLFCDGGRYFRRFIVQGWAVVGETVPIAVDAVDVMCTHLPEPHGRCSVFC